MTDDNNGSKDSNNPPVTNLRSSNSRLAAGVGAASADGTDSDVRCSFCGKGPDAVNAMVSKGELRICDLCVSAAKASLGDA